MDNFIKIIDAHHHYWDLKNIKNYPLFSNLKSNSHLGDYKKMIKNYLPDNLKDDFENYDLVGSVHIEAGWNQDNPIGEIKWLRELIDISKINTAAVAYAKINDPNLIYYLDKLKQYTFVKGIRMRLVDNINDLKENDNLLNNSTWLKGFQILKKYDFSFELQASYKISSDVCNFLKKNDDIKVIISHAAFPNYKNLEEKKEWLKFIKKISFFENVYLKISGIPMMLNGLNKNEIDYLIKNSVNILSPDKVIFGSNFPVDKLFINSHDHISSHLNIFNEFGKINLNKIIYKNAKKFYAF